MSIFIFSNLKLNRQLGLQQLGLVETQAALTELFELDALVFFQEVELLVVDEVLLQLQDLLVLLGNEVFLFGHLQEEFIGLLFGIPLPDFEHADLHLESVFVGELLDVLLHGGVGGGLLLDELGPLHHGVDPFDPLGLFLAVHEVHDQLVVGDPLAVLQVDVTEHGLHVLGVDLQPHVLEQGPELLQLDGGAVVSVDHLEHLQQTHLALLQTTVDLQHQFLHPVQLRRRLGRHDGLEVQNRVLEKEVEFVVVYLSVPVQVRHLENQRNLLPLYILVQTRQNHRHLVLGHLAVPVLVEGLKRVLDRVVRLLESLIDSVQYLLFFS